MIQFVRRRFALPFLLILATVIAAPAASAHTVKHSHTSSSAAPALQLLFGALALASSSSDSKLHLRFEAPKHSGHHHGHGHDHGHSHKHHSAPALIKVHADLCVKGTSWLNARSGPSTQYRVVAKLSEGERVHVKTCKSTNYGKSYWCKIDLGYGQSAHVSASYLDACHHGYHSH